MPDCYNVDSRKVTLGEYWNITRSWTALVPWVAGLLGMQIKLGSGFERFESVRELEIHESSFSPEARTDLQPLLDQCSRVGFHTPRFYAHQSLGQDVTIWFISMLHRSGEFTLRLMRTQTVNSAKAAKITVVLLSELQDGTYFFTSDQRPKFKTPPGILANRMVGASPARLIDSHLKKLAGLAATNPAKPVQTPEALDNLWDRYEHHSVDYGVRRGLYMRMDPEVVATEKKLIETSQTLTAGGVPHADVLTELTRLQNKTAGWGNAILILVVSLVLFAGAGAGAQRWSSNYLLILVPVLFVHELGHYLAMRAFNYRNLRMFFIPFFGAAVSGRHYNVPGWKKVIVSLMGPVPGIVLGVIIGGAGMVLHQPLLIRVALVMLLLNGINLLPILPLDGGWVCHALIFSRHELFDAGFRVIAAVALTAGGMFTKDKILLFLGIPMLLGIPQAYRMARITRTLRLRGTPQGSPDDQTVPQETAIAIIDELKKGAPKAVPAKMLAEQTLQVFESLNSRPPGVLATVGLLTGYAASIGMAGVFAAVLLVARRGDSNFLLPHMEPKHPLTCDSVSSWRGKDAGLQTNTIAIVADFKGYLEATRAFEGLTNRLPAEARLTVFGDSILLTLPAGASDLRKQWFGELKVGSTNVFVTGSNMVAELSISCRFATEEQAKQFEQNLEGYFSANLTETLVPPWHPEDRRTPEQKASNDLARQTYLKAEASGGSNFDDPRARALLKQMRDARAQGDDDEADALAKKLAALYAENTRSQLDKLKAGSEGPVDPVVVDLFAEMTSNSSETNRGASLELKRAMAARMGELPNIAGVVNPADGRYSASTGLISREKQTLQMMWVTFVRFDEGAPALVQWLCARGGAGMKYSIVSGAPDDSDDDNK